MDTIREKIKQFRKASRFKVIPVMLIPVALGALGAYVWDGEFNVWLLLLTLLGSGAAHLFSNMINDLWDYKNGTDKEAFEMQDAISTNSGFLTNEVWSLKKFAFVTWALFAVAALSGIILSFISGWWAFIFGALGGLIAYFYVAPPIRFGYRGKGYSEIAILLSFGVLPVTGAYYVQTSHLDYRALLLSLPIGILTTLVLFNHHFLHWQADRQAGKRTLVVVWGEQRALRFSRALLLLAILSHIACVATGIVPVYSLVALLTALPLYSVYGKLKDKNPSIAYAPLMGASVKTASRFGVIVIVSLVIQGLI
ncbi:prenyltransferase [Cohnella sp. AR92]|uniref:prenyltransferase n=1 Tax=Cohnella sp. AR92 TaxID=648716 RepID=UPI000F8E557A|nr:prenyltransferase [Cohnella sp. AR92]RUS48481.1 prenyltransferase [Cohnella sp. AR92]